MKQAKEKKLESHDEVIAVVKKFYEVKNTYYQMLIVHRIQQKATAFHDAANQLKQQAERAKTGLLKKLNDTASQQMQQVVDKAQDLKDEADKLETATDSQIVTNYLKVENAYEALATKKQFTAAKDEQSEVKAVKTTFGPLQKSYENVLRLRVQELAIKANTLSSAASQLNSDGDLTTQAGQLATAASHSGSTQGLKEKAESLVTAINSPSGDTEGTKVGEIIDQFEIVTNRYNDLAEQQKYQELLKSALDKIAQGEQISSGTDDEKVKNVYDAYNDLKSLYYLILNLSKTTKLKEAAGTGSGDGLRGKADELYSKANELDAEVKKAGEVSDTTGNSAKVLKAKAGTGDTDTGKLRQLAKDLYDKAEALQDAGVQDETTGEKLRKTLKDLNDEAIPSQLPTKATEVRNQYTQVSGKFHAVEQQNGLNKYDSHEGQI